MISDDTQLAAALHQMAYHADVLEGLRRYADETGDAVLLPTTSGGHIVKLRELIAEAQEYVEALRGTTGSPTTSNGASEVRSEARQTSPEKAAV